MKLANNKFGPVLKVENLLALLKARMNPAQARFLSTIHKTSWKLRSAPIYRTGQTSSRLKTKENIYCCCITYYLQEEKEDKKFKSFSRDTWYVQWYVWKSLWSKKTLFFCTIEIKQIFFQIFLSFFLWGQLSCYNISTLFKDICRSFCFVCF